MRLRSPTPKVPRQQQESQAFEEAIRHEHQERKRRSDKKRQLQEELGSGLPQHSRSGTLAALCAASVPLRVYSPKETFVFVLKRQGISLNQLICIKLLKDFGISLRHWAPPAKNNIFCFVCSIFVKKYENQCFKNIFDFDDSNTKMKPWTSPAY